MAVAVTVNAEAEAPDGNTAVASAASHNVKSCDWRDVGIDDSKKHVDVGSLHAAGEAPVAETLPSYNTPDATTSPLGHWASGAEAQELAVTDHDSDEPPEARAAKDSGTVEQAPSDAGTCTDATAAWVPALGTVASPLMHWIPPT